MSHWSLPPSSISARSGSKWSSTHWSFGQFQWLVWLSCVSFWKRLPPCQFAECIHEWGPWHLNHNSADFGTAEYLLSIEVCHVIRLGSGMHKTVDNDRPLRLRVYRLRVQTSELSTSLRQTKFLAGSRLWATQFRLCLFTGTLMPLPYRLKGIQPGFWTRKSSSNIGFLGWGSL